MVRAGITLVAQYGVMCALGCFREPRLMITSATLAYGGEFFKGLTCYTLNSTLWRLGIMHKFSNTYCSIWDLVTQQVGRLYSADGFPAINGDIRAWRQAITSYPLALRCKNKQIGLMSHTVLWPWNGHQTKKIWYVESKEDLHVQAIWCSHEVFETK